MIRKSSKEVEARSYQGFRGRGGAGESPFIDLNVRRLQEDLLEKALDLLSSCDIVFTY